MSKNNDYEEVLTALSMNREIEFSYKDVMYALVYHQEGWCFVNRDEKLSPYYQDNMTLINSIQLDNHRFRELLENGDIKIETIF